MKKFLIIIYIIIFIALSYYVINLFINRDSKQQTIDDNKVSQIVDTSIDASTEDTYFEEIPEEEITDTILPSTSTNAAYTITLEDCNNECANITNKDKASYCNQICGFTPSTENSCAILNGLDKDYCIRDTAIQEKDLQKCTDVDDKNIQEQCINRINEDFIDEVM